MNRPSPDDSFNSYQISYMFHLHHHSLRFYFLADSKSSFVFRKKMRRDVTGHDEKVAQLTLSNWKLMFFSRS